MKRSTFIEAMNRAGYRETYAMKNATSIEEKTENGEQLFIFTYSDRAKYQDANGATYNATRKAWIG